jgi:hypothetical protein
MTVGSMQVNVPSPSRACAKVYREHNAILAMAGRCPLPSAYIKSRPATIELATKAPMRTGRAS